MITPSPFEREFDAATADLPGRIDHEFVAPGAGARALVVVVEPWGMPPVTLSFAAPDPGRRALSDLAGTSSPTGLCVVERGTAFLGDVLTPSAFKVVPVPGPVVAAVELAREDALLLLTPWTITAVRSGTPAWTTRRIAIDGLRVDEAADGHVRGVADPGDEEPRDFAVDLATGVVTGGAPLP